MDILIVKPKWADLILLDAPKRKTWKYADATQQKEVVSGLQRAKHKKYTEKSP